MAYIYAYSNGRNWSGMLRLNYGMRSMRFTIWFGWTTYWTLSKTITQVDHNTLNNHHLQEYLAASLAGSSDNNDSHCCLARPVVLVTKDEQRLQRDLSSPSPPTLFEVLLSSVQRQESIISSVRHQHKYGIIVLRQACDVHKVHLEHATLTRIQYACIVSGV